MQRKPIKYDKKVFLVVTRCTDWIAISRFLHSNGSSQFEVSIIRRRHSGAGAWISIASCPNSAHHAISMPKKSMPIQYHTRPKHAHSRAEIAWCCPPGAGGEHGDIHFECGRSSPTCIIWSTQKMEGPKDERFKDLLLVLCELYNIYATCIYKSEIQILVHYNAVHRKLWQKASSRSSSGSGKRAAVRKRKQGEIWAACSKRGK